MPMDKLSPQDLQSVDSRLGKDFVFDFEKSVEMRSAKGGTVSSSFYLPVSLVVAENTKRASLATALTLRLSGGFVLVACLA